MVEFLQLSQRSSPRKSSLELLVSPRRSLGVERGTDSLFLIFFGPVQQAMKIFNMLKLYGMPIKVNKSSQDKGFADVGANLFVGNLDGEVDEKYLYDTFSAFGMVTKTPKVARDPDTGESRGFGFVSFRTFEASDAAIEAMNGQFLYNRPVTVSYAFKKDSRGERHGTPAERLLAHKNRGLGEQRPHTMFAAGPGQVTPGHQGGGMPPPPMPPGGVFPPGGLLPGMHMPPPPMGMGGGYMRPPPPPMMYTNGGPPPPPPMNIHLPPGMQMQPMQPPPPPPPM